MQVAKISREIKIKTMAEDFRKDLSSPLVARFVMKWYEIVATQIF